MQTPAEFASAAHRARGSGDYLSCYDFATRGLEQFPASRDLAYASLLALADLGNLKSALENYEQFQQRFGEQNEDWLALRGRLYKELAQVQGAAADAYQRSAESYLAAYRATGQPYSGINAATMSLLFGDRGAASALAVQILGGMAAVAPSNERDAYYHHVTRAEAALILGRESVVVAALAAAADLLARDAVARSRTRAQLVRVCAAVGLAPTLVTNHLRLPEFACILPAHCALDGEAAISPEARAAAVFMTPGEISEVLLAERFAAEGAPLHLVLPAARDAVLALLADFFDADGLRRIGTLIAQARDVSVVPGFIAGEGERAIAYARQVAVGLSRLRARRTATPWRLLCGGADTAAVTRVGRAPDYSRQPVSWGCSLPALGIKLQRRHAALIFADLTGFSRLREEELPGYWTRLMPQLAKAVRGQQAHVLSRNTWGDALFLVLDDATSACELALGLVDEVRRTGAMLGGALAAMNLRVSVHYAPVTMGWDPVTLARIYYGSNVSLAARIEPVTPPGSVYVTESLAAQLAVEGGDRFDLVYAGEVELAKRHGRRRMFSLRPAAACASAEPPASAGDPLNVGCTGALLLTTDHKTWLRGALIADVLPMLVARLDRGQAITLLMGLSPGADLLFAEVAAEWLALKRVPNQTHSLLPVPPEVLLADWNQKVAASGGLEVEAETRTNWASMQHVLERSRAVVNLWRDDADLVNFATKSFRQHEYRRLGAHLVRHCDVLVAIYDRSARGEPGGTAEIVKWWRDPTCIPAGLQGPPRLTPPQGLVVLDPVAREVVLEIAAERLRPG